MSAEIYIDAARRSDYQSRGLWVPDFPVLRPHAVQNRLLRQTWLPQPDTGKPLKFVVVPAGRRSGKTECAKRHTLRHVFARQRDFRLYAGGERPRYFFAAPTRAQVKRIYWKWLKQVIPQWCIVQKNESDLSMLIWLPCYDTSTQKVRPIEIELWCTGLSGESAKRIEGIPWDGGVVDEYADVERYIWHEVVRPLLADRDGWCWLIGVPAGRNHYWELWNDAQVRPGWGAYTWFSSTILPEHIVEDARRDMDPRSFRQEMEGSFEALEGLIYYGFDPEIDVHEFSLPPEVELFSGMDFNVNPMAAVIMFETYQTNPATGKQVQHLWVWQDYEVPTSNTREMAKTIKQDHGGHTWPMEITPDASGSAGHTSQINDMTDHRILEDVGFDVRCHNANPSRRDRHNATNSMFENGASYRRIHIHPRCKHLIRALGGLVYKDGTNDPRLVEGFDHITDAFSYAVEFRYPIMDRTLQTTRW